MAERIGPYTLLERLGRGGMGAVWRARDSRDGRAVALKVLHEHLADDAEYVRRFQREAELAAALDHPNIVRVLEHGNDGDRYYLAMELVEGETLAERLARTPRLDDAEIHRLAIAVASALEAAHANRMVHRDIKPGNILLGRDGSIKVSDFGIARALDSTRFTHTGIFIGSAPYSAPETWSTSPDAVNQRADLYSLGIVLYEMLEGRVPFNAPTPQAVMQMQKRDKPPNIERIELERGLLGALTGELLEKNPNDRPQSARDVLALLNDEERRPTVAIRRPSDQRTVTLQIPVTRKQGLVGLGALALIGLIVGLVFALGSSGGEGDAEAVPSSAATPTAAADAASVNATATAERLRDEFIAAAATSAALLPAPAAVSTPSAALPSAAAASTGGAPPATVAPQPPPIAVAPPSIAGSWAIVETEILNTFEIEGVIPPTGEPFDTTWSFSEDCTSSPCLATLIPTDPRHVATGTHDGDSIRLSVTFLSPCAVGEVIVEDGVSILASVDLRVTRTTGGGAAVIATELRGELTLSATPVDARCQPFTAVRSIVGTR